MEHETPVKRKRGGQPGNRNAIGNRGNLKPRPNIGNRGGGAPIGNRNARMRLKEPHLLIYEEYKHIPAAAAWIIEHADELSRSDFKGDNDRDRALFGCFVGLTPEALSRKGLEYRYRLFTTIEGYDAEDDDVAA